MKSSHVAGENDSKLQSNVSWKLACFIDSQASKAQVFWVYPDETFYCVGSVLHSSIKKIRSDGELNSRLFRITSDGD